MSDSFRALRLNKNDDGQSHEFVELTENDLMEGDVTIACVDSSGVSPRRMPRDMQDALRSWQDGQQ